MFDCSINVNESAEIIRDAYYIATFLLPPFPEHLVVRAMAAMPTIPSGSSHCIHKLPTSCQLTAQATCCACGDKRPQASSFSRYIDGVGFCLGGTRQERYCPNCHGKHVETSTPSPKAWPLLHNNSWNWKSSLLTRNLIYSLLGYEDSRLGRPAEQFKDTPRARSVGISPGKSKVFYLGTS